MKVYSLERWIQKLGRQKAVVAAQEARDPLNRLGDQANTYALRR